MNNIAGRNSERNYLFDNMKGILIFLVVWAHVLDIPEFPFRSAKALYTLIYFFHMPAFIFISGYFSKNIDKCRDTALQNLFIPYCILNLLIYAQDYLIWKDLVPLSERLLAPKTPFRIFSPGSGCWFLFAMFIWRIFLRDIIKLRFCIATLFALGLISGFSHEFGLRFSLSRLAVFTVFYVIGYYTEPKHIAKIRKIPKVFSWLCFIGVLGMSWYLVNVKKFSRDFLLCNTYYDDKHQLEEFLLRALFYVIAPILTMALINLATERKTFLSVVGKNSIVIYILHLFIYRYTETYLDPLLAPYLGEFWSYLIYVTVLSLIIVYILSRQIVMDAYTGLMKAVNGIIFRSR